MKTSENLIIYNARLVDSKTDSLGMLAISNKKIKSILLTSENKLKDAQNFAKNFSSDFDFFDAKGLTVMPSFIDMHAHFRYPGQTQKEDLDSGLQAAVAGGFTTLVLMPNTNPVISTAELAKSVMKEAKSKKLAKIFQTISITKNFEGKDTSEIDTISSEQFPVISEDGRDVESSAIMLEAMAKAGKKNIIVACHCEDVSLAATAKPFRQRALSFMKQYGIPAGRINEVVEDVPSSVNFEIDGNLTAANKILELAEDAATIRNIEIAKTAGCHIHICHCSTKTSMEAVKRAKTLIESGEAPEGFNCTMEVTPHHLSLSGKESPNLRALVNPPLRTEDDRKALIEALKNGTADCIGTDHAPHTLEDKAAGSPGFSGIETAFAVCNSILVKKEGFTLSKLSELMSCNPAKILNLKTGRLALDYDADLAIVAPDEEWKVNPALFKSKGKSSPYEGKTLTGKVHATFYKGSQVFGIENNAK